VVVVAVALLLHPLRRQLEVVVVATLAGVVAVALLLHPLRRQLEVVVVVAGVLDGVVAILDGVVATILVAGVAIMVAGVAILAVAGDLVSEVSEQSCTTELLK